MNRQISNMLYHQERTANEVARINAALDHDRRRRQAVVLQSIITFDVSAQAFVLRQSEVARLVDEDLKRQLEEFLRPIRDLGGSRRETSR